MSRRTYLTLASLTVLAAIATLAITLQARTTRAAGDPTLSISNSTLTITLTASGSGLNPYTGYEIGIPYDPSVVTFSSRANTMAGGPFCVDNAGADNVVEYGCTLLSGNSTATGILGSVTFTATGTPGCFDVSITPYNGSNADTGTYTLDTAANPVSNPLDTSEIKIPVSGGSCASATPTATATNTATATATKTNTPTATATKTNTPTATATNTAGPTATNTATSTATNTATATATNTAGPSPTNTSTATATNTATATSTAADTATPTNTAIATNTAEAQPSQTAQSTQTAQVTRTVQATQTAQVTKTAQATRTAEVTQTAQASTTATTPPHVSTSTSTPVPTIPVSTSTAPAATATHAAATSTPQSSVLGTTQGPTSGAAGGASALPNTGQGHPEHRYNDLFTIVALVMAGSAIVGATAYRRLRQ